MIYIRSMGPSRVFRTSEAGYFKYGMLIDTEEY